MNKGLIVRGLTIAALAAFATDASAQDRSSTRGVVLGAHLNSSSIQVDEDGGSDAETGIGLGVMLGYGFSDAVTVFLRGDFAQVEYEGEEDESYVLGNVDLGARYIFGLPSAALRPYVELGLTGTAVQDDVPVDGGRTVDVQLSGGALMLGGGLEYFFSRAASLDVGLVLGKGQLTDAQVDGESVGDEFPDTDFTTVRLNLGARIRL